MTILESAGSVSVAYDVIDGPTPDAPVVLLSNSIGSTRSMWNRQTAALARHFRVVRYDTRGHGESPVPAGPYTIDQLADDAVGLLDRLGVRCAHVVGLSLGGMTAMSLAARYPDRVDRLALLCTSPAYDDEVAWRARAATVRSQGTSVIAAATVGRWYTPAFLESEPERAAAAEAMISGIPAEGYAACCEAIATMDLRLLLPTITAATVCIAGADDPAAPPAVLEAIARAVPGARFTVIESAAHLANDEQPDAVVAALLAHLLG
ncbi:3-oxoadipate enol-lactonase [Gordonia malaquae]|uniref:3-oxoadipate enol-lactonase n=1 Tax=Gordonia malaquae TaxID=410332 RepID=UPI0030C78C5F